MMKLKELAALVQGELIGDPEREITGIASLWKARAGEITFVAHKRYLKEVAQCQASAILVEEGIAWPPAGLEFMGGGFQEPALIRVKNPYLAFAQILELFYPPRTRPGFVSEQAFIGENAHLGPDVCIFPFVYVGEGAEVGEGTILYPFVFLGEGVKVGRHTRIYPQVAVYEGVEIGDRVIIHAGAVIGSDGFGFVRMEDGRQRKIPQIGRVIIEDEVEIGANVCIDRANLGETIVRRGVKFDNLAHVAHNVVIGENSLIVAQAGISGSCELGKNVILAGQAGLIDHIKVGDNAIALAQSGVTEDVPAGAFVSGSPAVPHAVWRRVQVSLPRLPELLKTVKRLEKKVEELEQGIKRGQ
ncbi:MAG: UDP-3-O-(3-hydroxymyristoyl)glucosamine N-acyltransferase [Candidatus Tectomicrobia bacterium]|uniref:UDP-3-O-acylglucosamine N-acyltransferase n=1 Tax=Tectimicrobiota bacterium TaxID=2528274 RepID=A0A932CNC2_UNCTE|nr:UDP-3-O-(3-hydroxymyristoyl)glucosamine N-acyltransferase [Candidatus Tectomicrobia bacterium]